MGSFHPCGEPIIVFRGAKGDKIRNSLFARLGCWSTGFSRSSDFGRPAKAGTPTTKGRRGALNSSRHFRPQDGGGASRRGRVLAADPPGDQEGCSCSETADKQGLAGACARGVSS